MVYLFFFLCYRFLYLFYIGFNSSDCFFFFTIVEREITCILLKCFIAMERGPSSWRWLLFFPLSYLSRETETEAETETETETKSLFHLFHALSLSFLIFCYASLLKYPRCGIVWDAVLLPSNCFGYIIILLRFEAYLTSFYFFINSYLWYLSFLIFYLALGVILLFCTRFHL